jgi:hypothetical protein
MKTAYMIKKGGYWYKHPSIINAGFPYASYPTKRLAELFCRHNLQQPYKVVKVQIKFWEVA